MRSPEGHDDPPADPPAPEPSLVNEPPADPPADPPVDPPKQEDPPKDEPPAVEPIVADQLVVPEGFELQPELSTKFLEILNGDQGPLDKANALLALHGETLNAASEAGSKAWDDMQTEWKEAAKSDPDIGGAKLQPALTGIGKLIDEFGDSELRGVFDLTGAGNNPHVIKFLSSIAGKLTEGGYFKGGTPSVDNDPYAGARRMFPSASDSNKG